MRSTHGSQEPPPAPLGEQWVAVRGNFEVVDIDVELDELCQRVEAAGWRGLVISRLPDLAGTRDRCLAC